LLPPAEPAGPPFCTPGEALVLALDPVGGDENALPTALPPVEPCGPEFATCAHTAGAASITAAAIRRDFVMTFPPETKDGLRVNFRQPSPVANHTRAKKIAADSRHR
jgi:hypothetical protein